MNKDIELAVSGLRQNSVRYDKTERYYNGDHDLRFATEKFENTFGTLFREFALNLCPVICDAVKDKLRLTGFSPDSEPASLRQEASIIWQRSRMAMRAGEIHKEALKTGDAFVIVWPDARGNAAIYPNKASGIFVSYDEDEPSTINFAAKSWRTKSGHIRLNLFYGDRIEKYITRNKGDGGTPDISGFVEFKNSENTDLSVVPNPYGVVPVFHFANNADLGSLGRSELEAAIPIQDGLNKSVLDMLVAMEFAAYRQRWATGIEVEYDDAGKAMQPFTGGANHLWLSGNEQTRFGDFEAAELEQFLKVKDSFRIDMASVTGTPLHYFLQQAAGYPSGEALKKSETRFLAKIRDRQEAFGQVWADAMSFALKIDRRSDNARLIAQWEDPSPMSDRELLENILLKQKIGLDPGITLTETGYGTTEI